MKYFLLFFIFILLSISTLFARIQTAVIDNFRAVEVYDGLEINLFAKNCLRNSKLFAIVQDKRTGIVTEYEVPRIFYDIETLEAEFLGFLPVDKNQSRISFKIVNFNQLESFLGYEQQSQEEIDRIARLELEEEENLLEEEFYEDLLLIQAQQKESEEQQAEEAAQTVVVVVIVLPAILDQLRNIDLGV